MTSIFLRGNFPKLFRTAFFKKYPNNFVMTEEFRSHALKLTLLILLWNELAKHKLAKYWLISLDSAKTNIHNPLIQI